MDINKIEILLRAIELGSLSKASAEFLYTPSALSHILDEIENEIGIRFIKRTHKGIEVEKGLEEIVEKLKHIVELKEQTFRIAQEKSSKNTITIATYASLSKYLLPGIIMKFNAKFPQIRVNITVADNMREVFEENKADILFSEKLDAEYCFWEPLVSDNYLVVIPDSYDFSKNVMCKDELYNHTIIMANDGKIASYIDKSKTDNIISVDSHDDSTVIHMVKAGIGIAILPTLSVQGDKTVKCTSLKPDLVRTLGLTYRKDDFKSKKELRDFIKCIKSYNGM